ncbi:hypothetical protein [Pedobacter cryoconitis]|nr:hypothetical protein [Pedobacter cryoconitis]
MTLQLISRDLLEKYKQIVSENALLISFNKLEDVQLSAVAELLALEDPVLESKFHAGNPAYKDPRFEHLSAHLESYRKQLGLVGVTRKLLWEEYIIDYQQGYSYSQFCFHLQQQLRARRPGMKLEHWPADKLFVYFAGKPLHYIDHSTGEVVACQVFVACLPFSDYSFTVAVSSQRIADFLHALGCCLQHIGERLKYWFLIT